MRQKFVSNGFCLIPSKRDVVTRLHEDIAMGPTWIRQVGNGKEKHAVVGLRATIKIDQSI